MWSKWIFGTSGKRPGSCLRRTRKRQPVCLQESLRSKLEHNTQPEKLIKCKSLLKQRHGHVAKPKASAPTLQWVSCKVPCLPRADGDNMPVPLERIPITDAPCSPDAGCLRRRGTGLMHKSRTDLKARRPQHEPGRCLCNKHRVPHNTLLGSSTKTRRIYSPHQPNVLSLVSRLKGQTLCWLICGRAVMERAGV